MDFVKLLDVAQQNKAVAKQPVACYQTKFSAPKKETKQTKALSENIKKFLERKEEEERRKKLEEKKKKENLLSLRDQKTQNRINKHLKVVKAANKAVLADCIENENTAITLAGPSQPDEDDYGYVSQEASEFYNRLMDKYKSLPPEKPLFSDSGKKTAKDISSTKDRVKEALRQQELEQAPGHRRRRSKASKETTESKPEPSEPYREKEKEKEKEREKEKESKPKIKKKPAPPPIDFLSLLKLAEKKQFEPIVLEAKPKQEEERPMTKKQQREYQKEKDWKDRKERQRLGLEVVTPKPTNDDVKVKDVESKPSKFPTIPKLSKPSSDRNSSAVKKIEEKPCFKKPLEKSGKSIGSNSSATSSSKDREREREREKEREREREREREKERERERDREREKADKQRVEISEERRKLEAEKKKLEEMRRSIEEERRKLALSKGKSRLEEVKSKSVAKSSSKEGVRNFVPKVAPKDVKSRQFPPLDVRASKRPEGKKKNKRRIESDEEYDSEMDDFIVDEDEEGHEDYSKYISEIFNYDKNKYRQYDDYDDDAAMESNFAQQLKEEFMSTKIGIMEDLEDMRLEKMMEARKKQMKANKKMRK